MFTKIRFGLEQEPYAPSIIYFSDSPKLSDPMNEQLRNDFLDVLQRHTRHAGLTFAEAGRRCNRGTRSGLDRHFGKRASKISLAQKVKDLAYELWVDGVEIVEPPKGRQNTPRLRHPDYLAKVRRPKKSAQKPKSRPKANKNGAANGEELVALNLAYRKYLPQHPSGAVNIYKIRRELAWGRERFDRVVKRLSAQKNPPFQFVGGDPHDFSPDKQEDSIFQDGQIYFSILWRS